MNKEERLLKQKEYRLKNNNRCTKEYEKTYKGFLMRLYRNMKSRITGVQKQKFHLYEGKELFDKDEFYSWALEQPAFYELFEAYKNSGFERKLAPSIDRVDSSKGYLFDNVEWVTMLENSLHGIKSKYSKNTCNS